MLINRDSSSRVPVVFPVPPTDDICLMPTPPSTPASLQKFPLLNCAATISNSTSCCSQDSISSDQQMVLLDLDEELTPSSTPGGLQMESHSEAAAVMLEQHQIDLEDPEFQSVLDVSSLLRLSTGGDSMRDDREGEAQKMWRHMQKEDHRWLNACWLKEFTVIINKIMTTL
ncbi:hypothetical protein ILYODFUR_002470 [Ilyodon furcidens]|uniref:Uncharacterized protein n=1 Tax=Ilyodon furcidens TaxID=33524 RepID=A0ABV0SUU8_9TELE